MISQECRKSGLICASGAVIGTILALGLATQFHWGVWGLVASLCVCPPLGWILADWKGFANSVKRFLNEQVDNLWGVLGVVCFLVAMSLFILVTNGLLDGANVVWSSIIGQDLLKAIGSRDHSGRVNFWIMVIAAFLWIVTSIWLGRAKSKKAGAMFFFCHPTFWPLICAATILWLLGSLAKHVYLYANSDRRRIAFSSIALGTTAGFATGYHQGLPLLGVMVGGVIGGSLGVIQHRFVYERLVQRQTVSNQS